MSCVELIVDNDGNVEMRSDMCPIKTEEGRGRGREGGVNEYLRSRDGK